MKSAEEKLKKREVKPMRLAGDEFCKVLESILIVIGEYNWLTEKFGKGEYHDIAGLCKIATLDEIAEKNYSLTRCIRRCGRGGRRWSGFSRAYE